MPDLIEVIIFVDHLEEYIQEKAKDIDDFEAFMIKVAEELRERYLED